MAHLKKRYFRSYYHIFRGEAREVPGNMWNLAMKLGGDKKRELACIRASANTSQFPLCWMEKEIFVITARCRSR